LISYQDLRIINDVSLADWLRASRYVRFITLSHS
jgi:hypothetical protein